uniref:Protein FRA10AC1 n=1 Tax=Daucus carota subsp. sativus TaxID=79200 RepID=A0A164Y101_DAUCS
MALLLCASESLFLWIRCAKKLNYKKQKEKEKLKRNEKEVLQRKRRGPSNCRERSESDDDIPTDYKGNKDRKKVMKTSTSLDDQKADETENFDEFLEGMFL